MKIILTLLMLCLSNIAFTGAMQTITTADGDVYEFYVNQADETTLDCATNPNGGSEGFPYQELTIQVPERRNDDEYSSNSDFMAAQAMKIEGVTLPKDRPPNKFVPPHEIVPLAIVAEPSTLALLAIGIGGIIVIKSFRSRIFRFLSVTNRCQTR